MRSEHCDRKGGNVRRVSVSAGRVKLRINLGAAGKGVRKTYLENLHEPRDVELRIEREVMHVRDEGGYLLLEQQELVLQGVHGQCVVVVILPVIVIIGAGVLGDGLATLLGFVVGGVVRWLLGVILVVHGGDETSDGLLGIVYATRELEGLD